MIPVNINTGVAPRFEMMFFNHGMLLLGSNHFLVKEFYVEEILQNVLLPFTQRTFSDGYRFQQDNDPKHKSKQLLQSYVSLFPKLNVCLIFILTFEEVFSQSLAARYCIWSVR